MKEEKVYHVDEHDHVIGKVTKSKAWTHRLIHRGTAVLVTNSNGEVLVHKRSKNKKIYSGYYDVFFGGWTNYGETYKRSAVREVQEELGIKEIRLQFLFKIMYEDKIERNWTSVYKAVYNGFITLQKKEIESASFMSLRKLKGLLKKEKFRPPTAKLFEEYLKRYHD